MSRRGRSGIATKGRPYAPVFAALGDQTRLSLIAKLSGGQHYSISQLTDGSKLTRQAITKHLRVLESAGIVHGVRAGRESLFKFDPQPIERIKRYLDLVSKQWDQALSRLKSFVEDYECGTRAAGDRLTESEGGAVVDEVTGEGQAEQRHEDSNEINDKTSRLEPSGLQLSTRAAVAKQAGQGQYDARDDRDGTEPNGKPCRR